jgi:hypothetical protein
MPTPPLSPELAQEALDAVETYGTVTKAAKALGLARETLNSRVTRASKILGQDPAIQAAMKALGTGMVPKTAWLKTTPAGDISYSLQLAPEPAAPEAVAERIVALLGGVLAIPEIILGNRPRENIVNLFANSDFHLGAVISEGKGHRAYNREIAVKRVKEGFGELHGSLSPADTALILDNGDRLHANDDRDVTVRSLHKLKVEGSHGENLLLGIEVAIWQIEMALTTHAEVIYESNPGNHDPNIPQPVLIALGQRYANNPRVTINGQESHYGIFQRGRLFICSHHGHGVKPEKMAQNIKHTFRALYGVSDFHYFYTGHFHSSKSDTFAGMHWRQFPSIVSTTQYEEIMSFVDTSGIYGASFDTAKRGRFKEVELLL